MRSKALLAGLAMAAALAGVQAHAQNLVQNGSFEVNTGNFGVPANWTDVGWFTTNSFVNAPDDGAYWLSTGCTGGPCTVSQDVATTPGQDYILSFDFNPGPGVSTCCASMTPEWNGTVLADVGVGPQGWSTYSYTVQATGALSNVTFDGYQGPSWNGLDNVSLTAVGGGGVPEPSMWALMLTGFFGAGSMLRRRHALA